MSDTTNAPQTGPKLLLPGLQSFYDFIIPLSWPLVRCAAGLILAWHGWGKVSRGAGPYIGQFAQMGFEPVMLTYWVLLIVEFVGGICIAIGLFTRFWAAAAAIEMAVLTFDVYWGNGFAWLRSGFEYVLLWGLILFAISLRGGGPYAVDNRLRWQL
jgi:putative oxidoreductase